MKFAMITLHNNEYQPLADITWEQNKKLYCEKHGYDALAKTDNFKFNAFNAGFDRMSYMIEQLESGKYDWIHAVGCDTMITNFNIKLEDLIFDDCEFIIATDCNGINADSFLVKNAPTVINWFKYLLTQFPKYQHDKWRDQQAMIDHLDMISNVMKIVPQRHFNSYNNDLYPWQSRFDRLGNDGSWQSGDFLIHWPGFKLEQRIPWAKDMLEKVIK